MARVEAGGMDEKCIIATSYNLARPSELLIIKHQQSSYYMMVLMINHIFSMSLMYKYIAIFTITGGYNTQPNSPSCFHRRWPRLRHRQKRCRSKQSAWACSQGLRWAALGGEILLVLRLGSIRLGDNPSGRLVWITFSLLLFQVQSSKNGYIRKDKGHETSGD